MRRAPTYLILALLAFPFVSISAQHKIKVDLELSMDLFRIVPAEGEAYRVEAFDHLYYYTSEARKPGLPLRTISVLVPNGSELVDFSFSTEDSLVAENLALQVLRPPVAVGSEIKGREDAELFTASFPDKVLAYSSTMIQRGYTWFTFTYSPFTYSGQSGDLKLNTMLSLELSYQVKKDRYSIVRPDRSLTGSLKERMLNGGDLDELYPERDFAIEKAGGIPIDYLIITSAELAPAFMPLLEWKIRKGLNAELITVDEIREFSRDSSIQLSIKRYLHERYLNGGLRWVLMGGDPDMVPVQGCYSYVLNGSTEVTDESIPTDLYYACFDKRFDWNALIDNKIGQVYHDDNDLVPEIYISRMPVRTLEQTGDLVRKTLDYEQNQPSQGFSNKMLLAGMKTWTLWSGKSDSHHRSELMYTNHISDYWDGEALGLYDTGTDFSGGAEYQLTAENLSDQLNTGYAFFHFAGHGDINTLQMEEGPRFDVDDAFSLSNSTSGMILSNACDVNAFDSIDPCLSEAFLRNPHGGGIAFFGSSRLGFGLPDIDLSLGPSFQFNASFLAYLLSGAQESHWNSFASVAAAAKNDFANSGISGGIYHYLLYAINPMGDPELPIYTRNPSVFNDVRLYQLGREVSVNTGGVSKCRICITSLDLESGYRELVENVSSYTFKDVPDAFQVTITAPNYKPYVFVNGSPTGVNEELSSRIRIYPNPVHEDLNLDFDLPEGRLLLFDIRGSFLAEQELVMGSNHISMRDYPPGTYLLKVQAENISTWLKLVRTSQ